MPTSSEHKTVQSRILAYAEAIGWTIVPREETEQRRGMARGGVGAQRTRFYDVYRPEYDKNDY